MRYTNLKNSSLPEIQRECKAAFICQSCKYHEFISKYIATPFIALGVLSNILCVIVWSKLMKRARKKRNVTCGIYLNTIGGVDIGMLLSFLFADSLLYFHPDVTSNHSFNVLYSYIIYPAFMFFTFLSFWLIAGVDTCRLTMVLFPIKLRQNATRVTNMAIAAIVIYCFAVNIPNFWAFEALNINGTTCLTASQLFHSKSYFRYRFWFQCIFLTVFPLCWIVFVNTIMLYRNFIKNGTFDNLRAKRGKEMGDLLFVISLWFVTIILWQCAAQCFWLENYGENNTMKNDTIDSSFAFAKLGMILNSSMKLPIYLLASSTFRNELVALLKFTKTASHYRKQSPVKSLRKKLENTRRSKSINAVMPVASTRETCATPNFSDTIFKQYRNPNSIQLAF